ncbi:HEAT repeat domain-containing protein [Microcoleus sp. FACHB-53]|nr:HEAT repeat domain-containing protein [Microcoleus sp. FACHB-53]
MSGQAGARGYIVQTLIGVLDSLEDREWHFLSIEPNIASDKVDVIWYYPERTKVVQVKHSQNQINWGMVKAWAEELEKSIEAQEYELTLIGPCNKDVASTGLHGKVSIPKPHVLNLLSLIEQAAHKLAKYLESKNIIKTTSQVRELLVNALTTELSIYSTKGSRISREDFDNLLVGWIQIIYPDSTNETDSASLLKEWNIPWSEVCSAILENQNQWLTTHALASGNRRVKDMYVPLGLVERKQPSRPERNISPEQGSEFYQEKITPIEHKDFFEQVLKLGISPKSNGRCIAIIGEPGAGKTTLLQKIASEVDGIPIWVDLADPDLKQEENLKDYLVNKWLEEALPYIRKHLLDAVSPPLEVTQEVKEAFKQEFYQGRVWLLLDGADEIAAEFGNPLTWVSRQIRGGWISEARLVLTCRQNVWDADRNALDVNFDVYRNLDFSYPEQVEEFIDKWLAKESEQQSRGNLKAQLNKAEERIKNLIKNPLRLMLLCRTWEVGGKLPDTKAGLYQRLVKGLYQLKDDNPEFEISLEQQDELNRKLGELALQSIDGKHSRFRLRESFIKNLLGHPEQESSLFWIARKLGWLNQVGLPMVEEKDSDEKVYAFFHPTFQEYFAACAIPDGDFFLPRNHIDRPVEDKAHPAQYNRYKIFELQWKEVFLLWMGQPKEKISDKKKECLLKALINFDDGTGHDFFIYRAYFIAASGVGEFGRSVEAEKIAIKLIDWCFFKDDDIEFPYWLSQAAKESLKEIKRQLALVKLLELLWSVDNEKIRKQIADYLAKIGIGNPLVALNLTLIIIKILNTHKLLNSKRGGIFSIAVWGLAEVGVVSQNAIEVLIDTLHYTNKIETSVDNFYKTLAFDDPKIENLNDLRWVLQDIRKPVLDCLGKIGIGNPTAIKGLQEVIETIRDDESRAINAEMLWKIHPGDCIAIEILKKLLFTSNYEWIIQKASWILEEISASDCRGIETLVEVLTTTRNEETRKIVSRSLGEVKSGNHKVIETLIEVFKLTHNEETRRISVESLGKVGTDNITAIKALQEILHTNQDDYIRREAAKSLGKIDPGNTTAIAALTELLHIVKDQWLLCSTATTLWEINHGNRSAIKTLRELCASKNENLCLSAAESLGKINPRDLIAIETLIRIACMDSDVEEIEREAAKILYAIGTNNKTVIETLIQFLRTEKNELDCVRVAKILGKIDTGNQTAIDKLIKIIGTTQKEGICWDAAEYLGEISPDHPIAIEALIKLLYNHQWGWFQDQFIVNSLRKLGIGNQNAIETLIQILLTSQNHQLRSKAAEGLKKIRQEEFLVKVVKSLKSNVQDEVYEKDFHLYQKCKAVILYCSQNLPYQKFYQAWYSNKDSTLSGEAQKLDFNQLQPTDYTYPLAINILSLKEETEQAAIAQKVCTKIYKHQAVKISGKPPTVKSDAELQQHLFEIQEKLQRKNLALVLYIKDANGFHEPTEEAIAFCQKLADPDLGIYIAWITNQSLEQPLKPIQPDSPKLMSKIQSWIDEIV